MAFSFRNINIYTNSATGYNRTEMVQPPILVYPEDKLYPILETSKTEEFGVDSDEANGPMDYLEVELCPTWYRKGDFSRPHEECSQGQFAAVVINFSKDFTDSSVGNGVTGKTDKGGGLTVCDHRLVMLNGTVAEKRMEKTFQAKFNTASLFWTMYTDYGNPSLKMPHGVPQGKLDFSFTYGQKNYNWGDEVVPGIRIMSMKNHFVEPVKAEDNDYKRFAVQG